MPWPIPSNRTTGRPGRAAGPEPKKTAGVQAFAAALPRARLYLAGVPNATKVDSEVYVSLIGEITRGADVATSAKTAAGAINTLTGCKS